MEIIASAGTVETVGVPCPSKEVWETPEVSRQRTDPVPEGHTSGRIHGPLGYHGLESSRVPWTR